MTCQRINRLLLLCVAGLLATVSVLAQEEQRVFYSFDASNGLADNSAQTLKCTRSGRMVITTIGHVNFYDGDAFSHIDPQPEDVFPLPKYAGHYHLYFDNHHHLWLKDKYSVTCVNLTTEHFIRNVGGVIKEMGMKYRVDDLFGDSDNHMWFLSDDKLYGVDNQLTVPVASHAELQDVDVYKHKYLLQFFGNGRVSAYDINTGRHVYDADAFTGADTLRYSRSSVIFPDSQYYYQIRNGEKDAVLLRFDVEKRQWKKLLSMDYHLNNMDKLHDKLFIASEYGYWTYDVRSGETQHAESLQLVQGRKLLTDVNTVAFDRQGGMWLGTEKRGLLYSKPFASPFVNYTWDQPEALYYLNLIDHHRSTPIPLPRHVNCKVRDSRGWTWTGLYTGLQLVKSDGHTAYMFTKRDGLMNEMIHSVVEDDQHDIWVSTSFGISHLSIRGDSVSHIESYSIRDNVPNETFVNDRAIKFDDGTIVMQALDHIVTFNPNRWQPSRFTQMKLYPKLIRLMVNGHFITAGTKINGKKILDRAVSRVRELSVDYSQNNLSLTFSALNFMRPLQTYYRVRVKGMNDKWEVLSYYNAKGRVDSNGLLHMPLLGLSPGTYVIEMQASMTPDVWPIEPLSWVVHVKQPWWRRTGIYLLLGFLLVALLLANFFYYNRIMRLRMIRSAEEEDILKRIRNYAKRSEEMMSEVVDDDRTQETEVGTQAMSGELEEEFVEAMLKIIPYLREREDRNVSMKNLSELTGIEMKRLYEMLSANLYKRPYRLAALLLKQRRQSLEA